MSPACLGAADPQRGFVPMWLCPSCRTQGCQVAPGDERARERMQPKNILPWSSTRCFPFPSCSSSCSAAALALPAFPSHTVIGTRSWQRLSSEAASPQRWASGALGQHNHSLHPVPRWQLLGKDPAVTRGSADTPHPAGRRNGKVKVAPSRRGARAVRPITSLDPSLLQLSLPLGRSCQAVSADRNAK